MSNSGEIFSGSHIVKRGTTCFPFRGVSISCVNIWAACTLFTQIYIPIGFDISDEDIQQTLPGTLEAFEAGVSCSTFVLIISLC